MRFVSNERFGETLNRSKQKRGCVVGLGLVNHEHGAFLDIASSAHHRHDANDFAIDGPSLEALNLHSLYERLRLGNSLERQLAVAKARSGQEAEA